MTIREALDTLVAGGTLSAAGAESVFEQLLQGQVEPAQIAALLSLLQSRAVSVDELVGSARAMRRHVTPVPVDTSLGGELIDTCGTGGAPKTFNVSTLAAIVAAAAAPGQVRVAKHGNRSRTGRGSAELLAALGVNVDAPPAALARCLRDAGVCFCFAIHHHPAMRHAAPVRKSLGFPTIFNLLGPLTNPAGARRQVIGVYARSLVRPVAETLAALGAERAIVAHGLDGLDELSTTAPTALAHVEGGRVREEIVDAASLGVRRATLEELQARDLEDAARIARDVLSGAPGPLADIVCFNAAAALAVGSAACSLAEGMTLAAEALKSGAASQTLRSLAAASHAETA